MRNQTAFTLIELIVVILLVSILAVTAAPKMLEKNQFSTPAQRNELISNLRLAQLRALNDRSTCFAVKISASDYGIYQVARTNDVCGTPYVLDGATTALASGIEVSIGAGVNKDLSPEIQFDTNGRPSGGNCVAGNLCTLTVKGSDTAALCIESEGYIHGC